MLRKKRSAMMDRVLIDVATQRDFLVSNAALPVENRAEVMPKIRTMMDWAKSQRIPVVSCIEAKRAGDDWRGRPRHCIDGTAGQKKLPFTLLSDRIVVEADNSFAMPIDLLKRTHQVIFRKRTEDLLGNPKADRLLNELDPERFVLFGVGLESWLRILALGLLVRQKRVTVVRDACGYWDPVAADLALRQLDAKGVRLVDADEMIVSEPVAPARRNKPILRKLTDVKSS